LPMTELQNYTVTLGDRGRVVLPAPLRRQLGLHPGDRLILTVQGSDRVRLVSAREQARAIRGLFGDVAPDRSLVGELIAERREEAGREDRNE